MKKIRATMTVSQRELNWSSPATQEDKLREALLSAIAKELSLDDINRYDIMDPKSHEVELVAEIYIGRRPR